MADNPSTPVVEHPPKGGDAQDPSPLVMQMAQREIAQQHALFTSELDSVRTEILTRIDGMDKALGKVEQYPTAVDLAIARVREYFDEKFRSIEMRFGERDKRFSDRETSNKELLSEQRHASETAINKSEAATMHQLAAQTVAIRDIKERMDRTEGKTEGAVKLWGTIVAVVMVIGVMVGIITAFMVQ